MKLTKEETKFINDIVQLKADNRFLKEALQNFVNYITIGDDSIMNGFIEKAKKLLNKKLHHGKIRRKVSGVEG